MSDPVVGRFVAQIQAEAQKVRTYSDFLSNPSRLIDVNSGEICRTGTYGCC